MLWLWGLFDDIADFFGGLLRGGLYSQRQRQRIPVPDVVNMPFDKAWDTLVFAGFDLKVTRLERRPANVMGIVVGQYPPPGRIAKRNARVRVTVHHPPSDDSIASSTDSRARMARTRRTRVPDVRGLPFGEAWEKLTLADFSVRVDRRAGDPRPVVGPIVAQDPPPGTMAPNLSRVRLTVEEALRSH